jgi:hypothetical protein
MPIDRGSQAPSDDRRREARRRRGQRSSETASLPRCALGTPGSRGEFVGDHAMCQAFVRSFPHPHLRPDRQNPDKSWKSWEQRLVSARPTGGAPNRPESPPRCALPTTVGMDGAEVSVRESQGFPRCLANRSGPTSVWASARLSLQLQPTRIGWGLSRGTNIVALSHLVGHPFAGVHAESYAHLVPGERPAALDLERELRSVQGESNLSPDWTETDGNGRKAGNGRVVNLPANAALDGNGRETAEIA